ncbi:MAG: dihydrofolate reductase [Chitinophagaceae bacterium]|nr:dihydrofolate reductase [Chitinophagaceae bacterium]MCA6452590.1 dihydrofolate reductase [Chitinophagaceae bacterium]MCA6456179.1 dihydrofolate reductase [Chitinophagaceae bacterium]MCA6458023.1 dihydrofolate reductase [Chitinophagaceae bacterium]MCA6463736.1 dihydrofolate reductase [Chitinophagaceae bacterium]
MKVSLVVAAAKNNAIGKDNRLLWSLPNDMKFFKSTTWAMPVLMGRKTYESLGKPLQGRLNIVITRQHHWQPEGVIVVHSLAEAMEAAKKAHYKEVFVIGGGEIYKEALPVASKIYLTRVDTAPDADTYFPDIDPEQWQLTSEQPFMPDAKHAFAYHFQVWERIKV